MSDLEERLAGLLLAHIEDSPCRFDHHGGCQEHGFLDLEGPWTIVVDPELALSEGE